MVAAAGRRATVEASPGTWVSALAVATVAAATWALMAAGWVDGTGAVLVTAVVATTEASLVARSSAGRVLGAAVAPLLGVMVIVPLTVGAMPDGGQGVRHLVARYGHALVLGLFDTEDWAFLVGLCGVMWVVGYWAGWMAVRERRGVLAVLPVYAVIAVNALNAPTLERVAFPEAVALALTLLLTARTTLAALEGSWRNGRVVALPGTRRHFTRAAVVAAGAVLALALLVPPLTTADLSGRLFHIGGGGGGSGHGGGSGGAAGHVEFSASVLPGGPLVDDPKPVLSYTTSTDEPVYLRMIVDTEFDSGSWFPAPDTGPPGGTPFTVPGDVVRDTDPSQGGIAAADRVRTVQARMVIDQAAAGRDAPAIFPGEPVGISSVSGDKVGSVVAYGVAGVGGLRGTGAEPLLLTVERVAVYGGPVTSMQTAGTLPVVTEDALRAAGTAYPDFVQQFRGVSAHSASDATELRAITDLARQWTVGAATPYDQATLIENHLRGPEFTYTLSPPAPPAGTWPIVSFLTRTRQGYCQYFASSMGVMLRALGIPARLVTGYGPGTPDDSAPSTRSIAFHTKYSVTSGDAHVWVEAYFPGYGWVPFEPTPTSRYGVYEPFGRGGGTSAVIAPQPPQTTSPTPTPAPTSTPRPAVTPPVQVSANTAPLWLFVLVLALVVAAAVVVATTRWLARPRTLGALWRRVGLVGRLLGVRHRPADTFAEYATRLAAALPPDTTTVLHRDGSAPATTRPVRARAVEALTELADAAGKDAYSGRGLEPQEQVRWRRAWGRLRRVLPLLLWRRALAR